MSLKRKELNMEQAKTHLAKSAGARQRELNARFLLLHLNQLSEASQEDLAALSDYVRERTWKSLRGRDRRLYLLLRPCVVKYKEQTTRLATLTMGKRESKAAVDDYKAELEQRLHAHLDKRCLVTRRASARTRPALGFQAKKTGE
jgi:hypothetical protein